MKFKLITMDKYEFKDRVIVGIKNDSDFEKLLDDWTQKNVAEIIEIQYHFTENRWMAMIFYEPSELNITKD